METQNGLKELLDAFAEQFMKDVNVARQSGALFGDETDIEIGRMVLPITAEKFRPFSPRNKANQKNLRRFV